MQSNAQAESFFSDDFQSHIATFLSYLTFWQDVLEHCRSVDVRHTLIDHFQVLFLQQLLFVNIPPSPILLRKTNFGRYPSLLESSDVDGGSAVAVLTYLRRILDALDHPELVHMILHYLLALPDYAATSPRVPRSSAALKRRQSLLMLNALDKDDDRMNPSLFNLVDLVLGSTESRNPQTVIAALKLTTVILGKNHGYALGSMIKIMDVHQKEPHRTAGALNAELETYLNIAIGIAGEGGVDDAYSTHLKDKLSLLESHPCTLKALALPTTPIKSGFFDSEVGPREVGPHYLVAEDPMFKALLDLLLRFLTNDVETNLALTEAFINLGTCSQLRLEGWLSVDPADYHFQDGDEEPEQFSNENLRDMYRANRQPSWDSSATPPLLACLQSLQAQVDALRGDIRDWDDHVANRKYAFRFHEEMLDAIKASPTPAKPVKAPAESPAGSWTPQIPKYMLEGSTTPSRTQSPRGRKEGLEAKHTPAASPAPSKLGGATLVGSSSRGDSPLAAPRAANRTTTLISDVNANFAAVTNSEVLKRRIQFRRVAGSQTVEVMLSKYQPPPKDGDDDADATAGAEADNVTHEDDDREASLLHIITNVVILQEFVLEIVALMQVRASLFSEVKFA
jgi:hypothetical protein